MRRALLALLSLVALACGALTLCLWVGVGLRRLAPPGAVATAAALLVLMPGLGLARASQRLPHLGAVLVVIWCLGLVSAFPMYFPGERAASLQTGLTVFALGLGVTPDAALGTSLDALLPALPEGRVPPPEALVAAEPAPLPPPAALAPDQVALPFEGEGRTLSLPVTVVGPREVESEVWMLFDTGATLTTLDLATLAAIGVAVRPDAPEVEVHTAAGEQRTRLALLDRVWVGGLPVEGVTVSVCDPCAGERTVGLLGLNVSGRFLSTVDHQRQEILLQPQGGEVNRVVDIAPWTSLGATATRWPDGRTEVDVRLTNNADRAIADAVVEIRCDRTYEAHFSRIAPRKEGSSIVSLPAFAQCDGYKVALSSAVW